MVRRVMLVALLLMQVLSMSWMQNIPSPTLGGSQLWSDQFVHGEWRIQQNVLTRHYRLLNEKDVRQTWGTYDHCLTRFHELEQKYKIPALNQTAVVTLHGLGRTRNAMQGLADFLTNENEWTSINVTYASTRESVADHARALKNIVDNLEGVSEVHFVGHSLGNIVIRRYLKDRAEDADGVDSAPSVGRVVMLAPPSQGSAVARLLKKSKLFEWIGGKSGQELGPVWTELEKNLGVPTEFGVIAGSTAGGKGTNPLIDGDDDLVVGVDETKLAGASDFLVVDSIHTTIMDKDQVQQATLRFLQHGYFVSPEQRQSIPAAPANAAD